MNLLSPACLDECCIVMLRNKVDHGSGFFNLKFNYNNFDTCILPTIIYIRSMNLPRIKPIFTLYTMLRIGMVLIDWCLLDILKFYKMRTLCVS